MDHGGDELDLLGHTLGEFLDLLVPPVLDAETDEPVLQFAGRVTVRHPTELRQVHCLVTDLHLAVQAALFREIADMGHVGGRDGMSLEPNLALGGDGDAVDDADEGRLARSVRPEQAEDLSFGDVEGHVVQRHLLSEVLGYMFDFYDCHVWFVFCKYRKILLKCNKKLLNS